MVQFLPTMVLPKERDLTLSLSVLNSGFYNLINFQVMMLMVGLAAGSVTGKILTVLVEF